MTVGINGFGRIGKNIFKLLLSQGIEVSQINDPFITMEYIAYALKYDSVHKQSFMVEIDGECIVLNGKRITVSHERDPSNINWNNTEIVVESSGVFNKMDLASKHRAPVVICTGPSDDIPMFVYGVGHEGISKLDHTKQIVISGASCTTNCVTPILKVVNDTFGVKAATMTTIHSVTISQSPVDSFKKELRHGRSLFNIIPTTTGATKSVEMILPELSGKLTGICFRVPVENVSVADLTISLERDCGSIDEISKLIRGNNPYNIMDVTSDAVVSADLNDSPYSCVFDTEASLMVNGKFIKLVCWYDNEHGYSNRIVDLIKYIREKMRTS